MGAHVLSGAGVSKICLRKFVLVYPVSLYGSFNLTLCIEIDAATTDPTTQIPGFVACVVNREGKMISLMLRASVARIQMNQ